MMKRCFGLIAGMALALTWAGSAKAASITFDPDGNPGGAVTVDAFNLNVSNGLSVGITANTPAGAVGAPGSTGTLLFQANLSNGTELGLPKFASCLGGSDCFTVVAAFSETVTANNGTTLQFALNPGGTNFFYLYANDTQQGDDLTGSCFTGVAAGAGGVGCLGKTLVLQGTFLNDGSFAASFTHAPTAITPLDTFGTDNYPGVLSIGGTGSFQGNVDNFTVINPNYFPAGLPALLFMSASSQNSIPFTQVNPSACFSSNGTSGGATSVFAGTATTCTNQQGVATVGGLNALTGPNTQLQTHASVAFNAPAAVPEPATMTLFGLGLLGAAASRRRKKNTGK